VSDELQPDPVTVTVVPVGPVLGVNDSIGLFTVKEMEIDPCCTYVALDIVTMCMPYKLPPGNVEERTVKVPVRTPLLSIVHDFEPKAVYGISVIRLAQVVELGRGARYPEPEMLPVLPGAPLFGVRMKVD
jgi:hypothetical protein